MLHKIQIIGNLGNDPELRYTQTGQPVTNFSVATSRKWTGNDGQLQEETIWFKVSTWGKLAEVCNEYLSKGRQVFIEGRLSPDRDTGKPRIWQDKSGAWQAANYEITAETVRFLGGRDGGQDERGYSDRAVTEARNLGGDKAASQTAQAWDSGDIVDSDEIPF